MCSHLPRNEAAAAAAAAAAAVVVVVAATPKTTEAPFACQRAELPYRGERAWLT